MMLFTNLTTFQIESVIILSLQSNNVLVYIYVYKFPDIYIIYIYE